MIGWIIAGAVVVLIALWAVSVYNGLVKLRNLVQEAWRQIDVELKRRHDLIGNLVETVKGYAAHERGTLEDVMKARSAAMAGGQSPAQQAQSEGLLSAALGRLIAVAEAYPDLKANQNFLALQQELTATEDRIAAARRYYNANVRELNTRVETVPSNVVANLFHIGRAEYFEAEGLEREPVRVDFGQREATIPPPSGYAAGPASQPGGPTPPIAPPTAAPTAPTSESAPQDHPER
jgi:LemA protein